ncbi:MAG: transposase, partial [Campylobacterales bacterium]|nr:transposase [Campylobacterales bacterium]
MSQSVEWFKVCLNGCDNHKEIKRRTKVVGAFLNEGSLLRLLVPLAVDTNAKWLERKYI